MVILSMNMSLNDIKVPLFFGKKNIEKMHSCRQDKNYYYFWKSNFLEIHLIVGSRNMMKVSKKHKFVKN